jgi:hypothetical protein
MTYSVEKLPDMLLVLIDIDDPITYDKEFQRSIRYSPYVCGSSEMSPRNRKVLRAKKESPDPLFENKFILEILVDKFGEFAAWILPNPMTQRSLIFRKLHWSGPDITDIPEAVLKEMEQEGADPEEYLMEEQELTHIYELTSGSALMLHDSDDDDEWGGPEDDEDADIPEVSGQIEDQEAEDDEEGGFVLPTNKTVH